MGNACNHSSVAKEQTIVRITRRTSWHCRNEIYCSKLHLVVEFGCRNRVDGEKLGSVSSSAEGTAQCTTVLMEVAYSGVAKSTRRLCREGRQLLPWVD